MRIKYIGIPAYNYYTLNKYKMNKQANILI